MNRGGRIIRNVIFLLAGCLFADLALTSCAVPVAPKKEVVKECVLPEDQKGTLSGRWKVTPIPIAFHAGSLWDSGEVADIIKAADSWNEFYSQSLNINVFDYGDKTNPRVSNIAKPSTLCTQGIVQSGQFSGAVVLYKQGVWPANLSDAIALTSFCPLPAKPLPTLFMAVMEVNYQDFFVQGKKIPDLQSIITHEFGHLLGLDHSCGKNKVGMPECTSATLSPDYSAAVMFPAFNFDTTGLGEQKRTLTSNDEGRANCLYKDLVTAAPK